MSWYKLAKGLTTMINGISCGYLLGIESLKREEFMEKIKKMCEDKGYKLIITDPRLICHEWSEWSLEEDDRGKIHIVERKIKNRKSYSRRF